MLRGRLSFVAIAIGVALAFPAAAGAQATQDSVLLRNGSAIVGLPFAPVFDIDTINATSGPTGENPAGQVSFTAFRVFPMSGPVTCLAVNGNSATINIHDVTFGVVKIQVLDNQPDTFHSLPVLTSPTDCSPLSPTAYGGPISGSGDIVVVDAQPFPTSKDQCKNNGWRNFPGFKNEGDCVSFVATGGKKQP